MKFIKQFSAVSALVAVFAANAMAALPPEVATTTAGAKTDIAEAGALMIGVSISIAAVFWLRRLMK